MCFWQESTRYERVVSVLDQVIYQHPGICPVHQTVSQRFAWNRVEFAYLEFSGGHNKLEQSTT
jgi:hypothetical protein